MKVDRSFEIGTYIDLMTDFGFKRIFGEESNRQFLIDFLNALFNGEIIVDDVVYDNSEYKGMTSESRGLRYDIYCHAKCDETEKNHKSSRHFIIEMQRTRQEFFDERAVYYVSNAVARQGEKGSDYDFHLVPVVGIFFMNFLFRKAERKDDEMVELHMLMNTKTHELLNDAMRLYFIKLPLMRERAEECKDDMERWIYCIKNLQNMDTMPFNSPIFQKLGRIASVANLSNDDLLTYERELKYARDRHNQMAYAKKEAREEGLAEGLAEGLSEGIKKGWRMMLKESIANMKKLELTDSQIASILNITPEELRQLASENNDQF